MYIQQKRYFIYFMLFFYICGSCNYGLTKIYSVLPLILPLFLFQNENTKLARATVYILIVGFIINYTIYYNPIFFPVLLKPEIIVKKDSLLRIYNDKSASFDNLNSKIISDGQLGMAKSEIRLVKKGTRYKIKGIFDSGGIDSRNHIYIDTGEFHVEPEKEFVESKLPIENLLLKYFTFLLFFPFLSFSLLFSIILGASSFKNRKQLTESESDISGC